MAETPGGIDEERRRAFERARAAGDESPLADFLPPEGDARRAATLEELACIELELAWKRGDGSPATLDGLIARFPELAAPEVVARLAHEELVVRARHGDAPMPSGYDARFPHVRVDGGALSSHLESSVEWQRAMAAGRARPTLALPERLGRYELGDEIGRGSFARVFRAKDAELGRAVAIKWLRPEYADDEGVVERIRREARAVAGLRHPGIATVHEVGELEGLPYLVTDLIEGPTLEALLAHGHFEPRKAAAFVARIADALEAAHANGFVHRDVKPANVLTTRGGEPVLTDFGLALHASAAAELTREGDLLGTPAYMSPEQARGSSQVDARSDVYSLGVVLYHTLCGRLPFEGSGSAVLKQVLAVEPPAPRAIEAAIPLDLETICLQAMAKEPERRYGSAAAFAADLRRFLEHQPIAARRPGRLRALGLWCRRNPELATTVAVALLLIVAVAAFGLRGVLRERDRFRGERDVAQANLYRALVGEAHAQLEARGTGWWWQGQESLRTAAALDVSARDPDELRALAVRFAGAKDPCFRLTASWEAEGGAVLAVALDPRGELAASGDASGVVELRARADGRLLARGAPLGAPVRGVAFHPRGHLLVAATGDGRLHFHALGPDAALTPSFARDTGFAGLSSLAVSRDGRLAIGGAAGALAVLESWTAEAPLRALVGHEGELVDLAFTPVGDALASCVEEGDVILWDLARAEPVELHHYDDATSSVAALGSRLLFIAIPATYGFARHSRGGGAGEVLNRAHTGPIARLGAGGRHVFSTSRDGQTKAWNADFSEAAVAEGEPGAVGSMEVDADGRFVLIGRYDGGVRLWEFGESRARQYMGAVHALRFRGARRLIGAHFEWSFAPAGLEHESRQFLPPSVTSLAAVPGSADVLVGRADGSLVRVAPDGATRWSAPACEASIRALGVDAHGAQAAVGSEGGELALLRLSDGARAAATRTDLGAIATIGIAPLGGGRVLASGAEGTAWWDTGTGALSALAFDGLAALAGSTLAVGGSDGRVELRDLSGERVARTLVGHFAPVRAVHWDAARGLLLTAAEDRTLQAFQSPDWERVARLTLDLVPSWLSLDPIGPWLFSGNTRGGAATLWDLERERAIAFASMNGASAGALLADGRGVAGSTLGSVLEFRTHEAAARADDVPLVGQQRASGQRRFEGLRPLFAGGHGFAAWGCSAAPDGRSFATCDHGGVVSMWRDGADGAIELAWSDDGHEEPAWSVAFDASGDRLVSTSLDVAVWAAADGELLSRLPGHEKLTTDACFLPDGARLVSASLDGTLRVWNLADGALLAQPWSVPGAIHDLELDPTGRWLAIASDEARVHLYDLALPNALGGPPTRALDGAGAPTWAVGFDPGGTRLAAADESGVVLLRELPSFRELGRLAADNDLLRSVSFSRDGELLALGAYGELGVVWDLVELERMLAELGLADGRRLSGAR